MCLRNLSIYSTFENKQKKHDMAVFTYGKEKKSVIKFILMVNTISLILTAAEKKILEQNKLPSQHYKQITV